MVDVTTRFGSDEELRAILAMQTWAVIGLSPDPYRASYGVAQMLLDAGKTVIPVHPAADEVLGLRAFRTLAEVPVPVDVVDVFRRSEEAGQHVEEAIAVGAKAVWFQLGVVDEDAYGRAHAAGLLMVMNTCPAREWPRLMRSSS